MDDPTLLEAWRGGDTEAGRRLVRHYYQPIYRFFYGKVSDDACEDLTQETFEVLIRRREGYRGEGPFRAYLYSIARFVLIAHIRRRRRQRERFEPAEHSAIDPATAGGSEIFATREQERVVAAALRSLPLDDQITIELKDWEGLTQDELAVRSETGPCLRGASKRFIVRSHDRRRLTPRTWAHHFGLAE